MNPPNTTSHRTRYLANDTMQKQPGGNQTAWQTENHTHAVTMGGNHITQDETRIKTVDIDPSDRKRAEHHLSPS